MKLPTTFILGFPRSGTTFLAHLLSQSSDVFVPNVKEPKTLDDRYGAEYKLSRSNYGALYADTSRKITIDASTSYVHSTSFFEAIKHSKEEHKFIVCWRQPSVAAYSLYLQLQNSGVEHRTLNKWSSPNSFRTDYEKVYDPKNLYRLKEQFGDRVFVQNFDTLIANDFRAVFDFLDASTEGVQSSVDINAQSRFKSEKLRSIFYFMNDIYRFSPVKLRLGFMRRIKNNMSTSLNYSIAQEFLNNNSYLECYDREWRRYFDQNKH